MLEAALSNIEHIGGHLASIGEQAKQMTSVSSAMKRAIADPLAAWEEADNLASFDDAAFRLLNQTDCIVDSACFSGASGIRLFQTKFDHSIFDEDMLIGRGFYADCDAHVAFDGIAEFIFSKPPFRRLSFEEFHQSDKVEAPFVHLFETASTTTNSLYCRLFQECIELLNLTNEDCRQDLRSNLVVTNLNRPSLFFRTKRQHIDRYSVYKAVAAMKRLYRSRKSEKVRSRETFTTISRKVLHSVAWTIDHLTKPVALKLMSSCRRLHSVFVTAFVSPMTTLNYQRLI